MACRCSQWFPKHYRCPPVNNPIDCKPSPTLQTVKLRSTTHGISRDEGSPSSDAYAVRAWGETVVAVLADGAGAGEPAREAARRAVRSLVENYEARPRTWSPQRALREFTQLVNRTLYQE